MESEQRQWDVAGNWSCGAVPTGPDDDSATIGASKTVTINTHGRCEPRASLDALAVGTARLAADGNASARAVIEELRKRGVTVNAAGASKPQ